MRDMARKIQWGGPGGGYLELLHKRSHVGCEARNLIKAPTETAIPSARVRSILHLRHEFEPLDNHVSSRPVFYHTHHFGHYHVETDRTLPSAPPHAHVAGPNPYFHGANSHHCLLPQRHKSASSLSEEYIEHEEQYKEWMERARPMCPCSLGLLDAHPAAGGIFVCRRRSCVNQLLSLEEVNWTLAIPLNCETEFPAGGPDGSQLGLNPNAPEFVPRSLVE